MPRFCPRYDDDLAVKGGGHIKFSLGLFQHFLIASNSTEKIPKHNGSSSGIRGIVVLEIVVAVVVVVVEVDLDHLQS